MTKKTEGAELIARAQALTEMMSTHKIKTSELSAVTYISANAISSMRTGKLPIGGKSWEKLNQGIKKIVEERDGVPEPTKTITVKVEPKIESTPMPNRHIKPFNLPEYVLQHIQFKGSTVVNRSTVGTDPDQFLAYVKSKGFDCTMKPDRDGDWLVELKPPVNDEVIVTKSEPVKVEPVKHAEVIPHMTDAEAVSIGKALQETVVYADEIYEASQPKPVVAEAPILSEQEVDQIVKDVEKIRTIGDFLEDVFDDDTHEDEPVEYDSPKPTINKSPIDPVERRCCLLNILSRNQVAIDMPELIGSVMVQRLRRESELLWSVIETLDNMHSQDAFKDYVKDVAAKLLEVASQ